MNYVTFQQNPAWDFIYYLQNTFYSQTRHKNQHLHASRYKKADKICLCVSQRIFYQPFFVLLIAFVDIMSYSLAVSPAFP